MAILIGRTSANQKIRKGKVGYRPTRTIDTEFQYGRIVRRLMLKIEKHGEEPSIDNIVLLMEQISPRLAPATVRLYRSAVLHYTEQQRELGLISNKDAESAVSLLKFFKGHEVVKKSSGLKAKYASESTLEEMTRKLDESRSTVAKLAKCMIQSSVMVGLRPFEWFNTHLDGQALKIKNGKSTNGRGTGEFRVINLSNPVLMLNNQKIGIIKQTLSLISAALSSSILGGRTPENLKDDIRQVVRRCKVIKGGRSVTMYTARHQFAANMKAAGLSPREIADLMGHASPDTAKNHYGRKVSGHKPFAAKHVRSDRAQQAGINAD